MTPARLILAVLGAALLLAASACGGSGGVPEGAVAVVDGTEIPKQELDALLARTKKGFESTKQEFPKAGTPEYQNLQQQTLAFLVQREQFEQAAEELDLVVTDEDIDKELAEFVKSRFDGKQKEFEKALADQGFTIDEFRRTLHTSVLSQKLFDSVTKDIEVTDEEILAYYQANQSQYGTPESRDVRHILIAEKKANGDVDFAKSKAEADRIYAELRAGADFAALAKASSDDPGSKASGGKLTISRGQTVPEFDTTSFTLEKGQLSRPVKTTYGYHVIEALSAVRKAKTTPLDQVRDSIRSTLLQERRNEAMTKWVEDLRSEYESKISYASGFEPPELPEAPEETVTE